MQPLELPFVETRGATTFILNSAFEPALVAIRHAICARRLSIAAEIDIARRLKRTLQIQASPCRVLLVDNPLFMLQATAIDRASGVLIPLHVVVSGTRTGTMVHMLNPEWIRPNELSIGVRVPVLELRRQLLCMLSEVADAVATPDDPADRGDLHAREERT